MVVCFCCNVVVDGRCISGTSSLFYNTQCLNYFLLKKKIIQSSKLLRLHHFHCCNLFPLFSLPSSTSFTSSFTIFCYLIVNGISCHHLFLVSACRKVFVRRDASFITAWRQPGGECDEKGDGETSVRGGRAARVRDLNLP